MQGQRRHEKLRALNIEIGEAETRGDKPFFEDLLAPVFAIPRADGKRMDDRETFITAVGKSAYRTTQVESVTVFEANRALVVCIVAMEVAEGTASFQNVRLFTRESPGELLETLGGGERACPLI
jgi:hypothetical protein